MISSKTSVADGSTLSGPASSQNRAAASVVNGRPQTGNYVGHTRSGVHVQVSEFMNIDDAVD